jgi:hypothetical protein
LNDHQAEYLIAGGLAVVAHSYVRFTADLGLMLAMNVANPSNAAAALQTLNYRPRAPVEFGQFIDPAQRKRWIDEKGLAVFSLFSPDHPATEINLFVDPPLIFADAYLRAARLEIAPGRAATFCALNDLIELNPRPAGYRIWTISRSLRSFTREIDESIAGRSGIEQRISMGASLG